MMDVRGGDRGIRPTPSPSQRGRETIPFPSSSLYHMEPSFSLPLWGESEWGPQGTKCHLFDWCF